MFVEIQTNLARKSQETRKNLENVKYQTILAILTNKNNNVMSAY